jgi:inner membrane protein
MLFWTHLVVGLCAGLLFMGQAENGILFLVVALIASVFPDIDSSTSKMGKRSLSKVITAFSKHRGMFHSFTFMLILYMIFNKLIPIIALPFLVGYSSHLISDCFTRQGLRLFWPFRWRFKGFVRSGGLFEIAIFVVFLILDVFLIVAKVMS